MKKSRRYKDLSHVEPASVTRMNDRGRPNTVCDVLKRIFHKSDDEEVKLLARIATTMVKKMNQKLGEYEERNRLLHEQHREHEDAFFGEGADSQVLKRE